MTSGAPILRRSVRRGRLGLVGYSSQFSGVLDAEVDDAWDDFWRGSFVAWFYLAAKPSYMGVDVDRLVCPLHHPMVQSCQMRGWGLPPGAVLSYRYTRRWHLSGDVKPPGLRYLVEG
jgi:hypothetical protein